MFNPLWIKAALMGAALIVGVGARKVLKLKEDNIIEEVSEAIIEKQSGFDVDLSPDSPEVHLKKKDAPKKDL